MKKVAIICMVCLMAMTARAQYVAFLNLQLGTNVTAEETENISYNIRVNFHPDNFEVMKMGVVNKAIDSLGYATAPAKPPVPAGYTDLGLPSGTLWKNYNATGFYTYDEAVSQFGNRLPTKAQWEELKAECQWKWTGSGYTVTGLNGNSIALPASGYRGCSGGVGGVGSYGYYWSSTPDGSDNAWGLGFGSGSVDYGNRCVGRSVRLVQD